MQCEKLGKKPADGGEKMPPCLVLIKFKKLQDKITLEKVNFEEKSHTQFFQNLFLAKTFAALTR